MRIQVNAATLYYCTDGGRSCSTGYDIQQNMHEVVSCVAVAAPTGSVVSSNLAAFVAAAASGLVGAFCWCCTSPCMCPADCAILHPPSNCATKSDDLVVAGGHPAADINKAPTAVPPSLLILLLPVVILFRRLTKRQS